MLHRPAIGSSPRLRGTRPENRCATVWKRFIPAPAGNAASCAVSAYSLSVHPRACGEREPARHNVAAGLGSSPRLRGTPVIKPPGPYAERFIPAPAGNAAVVAPSPIPITVHPRACGERRHQPDAATGPLGSSPRLRGTPGTPAPGHASGRFIPAPAGNARVPASRRWTATVHPRACGERAAGAWDAPEVIGSSPRLRGTPAWNRGWGMSIRFIPAPAGNARNLQRHGVRLAVHPRACGERVFFPPPSKSVRGSSPRLRGTPVIKPPGPYAERFIPAPAGNAPGHFSGCAPSSVHPRACGERSSARAIDQNRCGSSPRLRGTRSARC